MSTTDEMEDLDERLDLSDRLNLACGDILSEKKNELALVRLFTDVRPGQWMSLRDSLPADLTEEVFAAWLDLPGETFAAFRLVIFFHEESGWTLTATYNVGLLLRTNP